MTQLSALRFAATGLVLTTAALGCGGKATAPPQPRATGGAAAPAHEDDGSVGAPRSTPTGLMMPASPGGSGAGAPVELLGKPVRIQFRRDALGMAATATLGPDAPTAGGRTIALDGTLIDLTGQWLVLRGQGKTYWIPQHVVLLIEAGG